MDAAAFSTGHLWIIGGLGLHCDCPPALLEAATTTWKWAPRNPVQNLPSLPGVAVVGGHLIGFSAGMSGRVAVLASVRGATWRPIGALPREGGYYLNRLSSLQATPNGPFVWLDVPCTASPHSRCALASSNGGATWRQHALRSCHGGPWCSGPSGSTAGKPLALLPAASTPTATAHPPGGTEAVAATGRMGTGSGAVFLRAAAGRWREIQLPGLDPDRVAFATSRFGLIETLGERFFVTTDDGRLWTQIP